MTIIEVKIKRRGKSLGFIIPRDIAQRENLKEGNKIKFIILKDSKKYSEKKLAN